MTYWDKSKPIYTLNVGEFIDLVKDVVLSVTAEQQMQLQSLNKLEVEEHLNIEECADFLNCSKVSVHKYKKLGMPFYRIGRKVLFKRSEILAFMAKTAKRLDKAKPVKAQ